MGEPDVRTFRMDAHLLYQPVYAPFIPEDMENGRGQKAAAALLPCADSFVYGGCDVCGRLSEYGKKYFV